MFSWFLLKDAEGNVNPLYSGYERLSADGTMFLKHDELCAGAKLAKTSTMPSSLTIQSKMTVKTLVLTDALCTKDEAQTKTLLATTAWEVKEVADVKPVEEVNDKWNT